MIDFFKFAGDWLYIKLPEAILLSSVEFFARTDNPDSARAPGRFKIYGSNSGSTWVVLHDQTSQKLTYANGYGKATVNPPSRSVGYKYIAVVVGSLVLPNSMLQINEMKIYGKLPSNVCIQV
jgi:hypothetical protein